jgi:hypothetical protein
MEGKDIAPALIEALSSQSTILSSMGLAVLGGLLAFSMQIIFHNHTESSRPIRVGKMISVWICASCEVAAVFLGYFISGAIVSALPILFNSTYAPDKALHENAIERLDVIRYLSLTQFAFFLVGAIAIVWFVASNLRLMRN